VIVPEPEVIVTCVRRNLRFCLSLRDLQELMAERGLAVHHYFLDQWRRKIATGDIIIVRYADEAVLGFEHRDEAERFLELLAGAAWEVRAGTAPGEDAPDRVRALRRRSAGKSVAKENRGPSTF